MKSFSTFLLAAVMLFLPLRALAEEARPFSQQEAVNGYESTSRGPAGLPEDWSNHHLIFPNPAPGSAMEYKLQKEPRFWMQQLRRMRADADDDSGANSTGRFAVRNIRKAKPSKLNKDWSFSLGGTAGVAVGMYPAKFSFSTTATPDCTNDFVAFPINASTGSTRAHVVGTISTTVGSPGGQNVTFTLTPTGVGATTLTLTSSTSLNTGLNFQVFTTASVANATQAAKNLAAAINRNLASTALGRFVGVESTNTVTIYSLTAGNREVLSAPTNAVTGLSFGTVTAGTNGAQANIVGVNQLYSGTSPFCAGKSFPQFTFSYASGVGPIATSPSLSTTGKNLAYVENDTNIGAILHVLTLGTGTEVGTCGGTNTGSVTPTCATTGSVIPGSTASSNATDFMLPLGLVALNAASGVVGAIDSFSSVFVNYGTDTGYIGDDGGILYSVHPLFVGTPAFSGGSWPVTVNAAAMLSGPVADVGNTGNIFVGDSASNLYSYSSAGTKEGATLALGNTLGGGIRDAPMVDSSNGVGYVTVSCNGTTSGLTQFGFTATTLTNKASAALDVGDEGCMGPLPMYAPSPDNNYFTKGISSATTASNGEMLVCYSGTGSLHYTQFQFTSGTMSTTKEFDNNNFITVGTGYICSPLTEFYGSNGSYALTQLTRTGSTVTITNAVNGFSNGQSVTIAGVAAGTGGCTAAAVTGINGTFPITVVSGTSFTYTSGTSGTIAAGACGLGSATATGPTDFMFFSNNITPELWNFTTAMVSATQVQTASNTTNIGTGSTGGTSGIIVDNSSTSGQAASIYFGNRTATTGQCGTTQFCAVKLTQAALQ